ncbi:MAG: fibronectin type III domain-containing protein [Candidatus Oxydemutatoraceae bacterium WSBS_2016_MAG_OTU14]
MKYRYRNNLVRVALSVFAVCTLLYIASASAHSSTQLNSLALTPEFSDAPVVTSLGPLSSEDITRDESYTSEAMTQGTATHEAPTMILAQGLTPLPAPEEVTAAFETRREGTATVHDIRVAWGSVENAESYTVRLYPGAGNVSDISALSTKTVSAPATTTVFENYPYSQFLKVGVTADSDTRPDSTEAREDVKPPKLSSAFFTITPGRKSMSMVWDISRDADLHNGANFYDTINIGDLDDSGGTVRVNSILVISIHNTDGGQLTSLRRSTEDNTYSTPTRITNSLSDGTNYVVRIVQEVNIGSVVRNSEALDIVFRTLEILPIPTMRQIGITATSDSVTVNWGGTGTGDRRGVSTYTISINPDNNNAGPMEVSALQAGSIAFDDLMLRTNYTISVIAQGDSTRYIGSPAYTYRIKTNYLGQLSTPIVIAVTENRRERIKVSWNHVPNAEIYTVKLVVHDAGLNSSSLKRKYVLAPNTTTTEDSVDILRYHYDAYVTATAVGYRSSEEVLETVSPRKLSSDSFNLNASPNSLRLNWNAEDGTDFYDKTKEAYLFFSIVDMGGNLVEDESRASTITQTHDFSGLSQATEYKLKITVGFTALRFVENTFRPILLKGEALEIPFNTLEELPIPREDQINWAAGETTLTVSWENAAAGVTSYELTLTREDAPIGTPIEVNALMASSTTFTNLDANATYTLSVVAKGDASVYAPSPQYRVTVTTNTLGQLSTPVVMLSIQSSVNIVVSWSEIANASNYALSLYSSDGERIGEVEETAGLVYTFEGLDLDLKFGTEYTVGVIAQNQNYLESMEVREEIVTERFILSAPRNGDIMLTAGPKIVTVQWSNAPEEVTAFVLSISPDTRDVGEQTILVSANEYPFENLLPDTEYTVSVVSSRDETGFDKSAVYMEATQTLSLPRLEIVTFFHNNNNNIAATEDSLALTWVAVTGAQSYKVNLYPGEGTSAQVESSMVVTATAHTFRNLNFGSPYTLEVIAMGNAENYRNSLPQLIPVSTARRPLSIPEGIRLTVTSNSLTVSWSAAPSEVDEYVINITPGTEEARTLNVHGSTETLFGNLDEGTEYMITVIARPNDFRYDESLSYTARRTTAARLRLRLRLKAFLEGPLQ